MKTKNIIFIIILVFLSRSHNSAADKVAQSKMPFVSIGLSSRAEAMGGAFTAMGADAGSIFYNPASIAYLEGRNVSFNNVSWIADIGIMSGLFSYHLDNIGTFSLNYVTVDYGTMTRTIVDAHSWTSYQDLGDFSVSEYVFGLGYAKQLTDRFSVGGQIKYIYQNLGQTEQNYNTGTALEKTEIVSNIDDVIAFDIGTYYNFGYKGIKIGMAIQNFANKAIPLTFRFGFSIEVNQIFFPESLYHKLLFAWDGLHPRDSGERQHYGLEYSYLGRYFLRAGYKANYDREDFSAGAGANINVYGLWIQVDYAYSHFEVFNSVNRFSIGLKF